MDLTVSSNLDPSAIYFDLLTFLLILKDVVVCLVPKLVPIEEAELVKRRGSTTYLYEVIENLRYYLEVTFYLILRIQIE